MKKVLAVVAAIGLMTAASAAFGASIVGSKHDLSSSGTASQSGTGTSTQICVYCHAPHLAITSLPLWNRSTPAGPFTLYSGFNMANVSFKSGFTADSTSLMCMSCHDGVTPIAAVHNAGAVDGTAIAGTIHTAAVGVFTFGAVNVGTPYAIGGTDLSKTHPINFPVSLTDSQTDLNVGSGSTMGPGVAAIGVSWVGKTFPLFRSNAAGARGSASRMLECGSCHAVHDSQNSPFLRYTMTRSELCLGCHNK